MFKTNTTFFVIIIFIFSYITSVFGIDDGKYVGAFKMTYGHGQSTSKKGDTGIFTFHIKNNKIYKVTTPDVEGWNRNAIHYKFKINPSSNELDGYCSVSDTNGSNYDVYMKGIFIENNFAGEGKVIATSPESVLLNKFIFENIQ